jgi:hypothetical protein
MILEKLLEKKQCLYDRLTIIDISLYVHSIKSTF